MPVCPFCHGEITADLERFGGACPHCFTHIPGEDAATDPNEIVQARINQEDAVVVARTHRRQSIMVLITLIAVIGTTAFIVWPSPSVEPLTFTADDLQFTFTRVTKPPTPDPVNAADTVDKSPRPSSKRRPAKKNQASTSPAPTETDHSAVPETQDEAGTAEAPKGGLDLMVNAHRGTPTLTSRDDIAAAFLDVFRARRSGLQRCYDEAASVDSSFSGQWKVSGVVNVDGKLDKISAIPQDAAIAPDFEHCLVREISSWSLAGKLKAPWPVSFPVSFG